MRESAASAAAQAERAAQAAEQSSREAAEKADDAAVTSAAHTAAAAAAKKAWEDEPWVTQKEILPAAFMAAMGEGASPDEAQAVALAAATAALAERDAQYPDGVPPKPEASVREGCEPTAVRPNQTEIPPPK